jgi:hypothetical protein
MLMRERDLRMPNAKHASAGGGVHGSRTSSTKRSSISSLDDRPFLVAVSRVAVDSADERPARRLRSMRLRPLVDPAPEAVPRHRERAKPERGRAA